MVLLWSQNESVKNIEITIRSWQVCYILYYTIRYEKMLFKGLVMEVEDG